MNEEKKITKIQELVYEMKVTDIMTEKVLTIGPEETIIDLREKMKNLKVSGLPVCEGEKMVGIISIEDLIEALTNGETDKKIKDKMTKSVEYLYSDELLIQAVNKFDKLGIGRFPVLDRNTNKLVGLITKGDIVKGLLKQLEIDYHDDEIQKYRASHIFEDIISDKSELILRYQVRGGDFKRAGEQSSLLKKNIIRLGFSPEIARRTAISAYEAEMNIVVYTSGGELIANINQGKISVFAVDNGPGIPDIELAMQPGYSTAPDWVRELGFGAGMGLPNIKKCSDEMTLESKVNEGTKLNFVIYLKK